MVDTSAAGRALQQLVDEADGQLVENGQEFIKCFNYGQPPTLLQYRGRICATRELKDVTDEHGKKLQLWFLRYEDGDYEEWSEKEFQDFHLSTGNNKRDFGTKEFIWYYPFEYEGGYKVDKVPMWDASKHAPAHASSTFEPFAGQVTAVRAPPQGKGKGKKGKAAAAGKPPPPPPPTSKAPASAKASKKGPAPTAAAPAATASPMKRAPSTWVSHARPCSTGPSPVGVAGRSSCASRTPIASARRASPRRRSSRAPRGSPR